jgi:hypothetical protein
VRRPRRSLVVGLAAALLCAVALPGAAQASEAGTITHVSGDVSATLAWDADGGAPDPGDLGVANPRLWVVRAGTRYDLTIADICEVGCVLLGDRRSYPSILRVVDLDGDGEPEILVDTYSGGAHCCTITRELTWDGTGYQSHDLDWQDVTYSVEDVDGDGSQELVGSDPSFAYAFSSYADSAFPVLVYDLVGGVPADTTKKYPRLIQHDAFHWFQAMRHAARGRDVRGLLAAYAADEYLLGQGATATREIAHQRRLRHISRTFGPFLLKKLHAWHYR